MRTWSLILSTIALAAPAFGDALSDARTHAETFARACKAGDVKAVVALYTDDAIVVWPGAGEEAKGKAAIEKLAAGLCDPKAHPTPVLRSLDAMPLGDAHIAVVGHWTMAQPEPAGKQTTSEIRTTEVLARTSDGWRYVVDHASIGLPPPPSAKKD